MSTNKNWLTISFVWFLSITQVFSYYVTLDEVLMNKGDLPRKERENM